MMLLLLLRLLYSEYIICRRKQPLYTPSSATHLGLPGLSLSGTFPDFPMTIAGPPSSALRRTAAVCGRKRVPVGRRHARNPPHQPQSNHPPHCADRRADRPKNTFLVVFDPPTTNLPGSLQPIRAPHPLFRAHPRFPSPCLSASLLSGSSGSWPSCNCRVALSTTSASSYTTSPCRAWATERGRTPAGLRFCIASLRGVLNFFSPTGGKRKKSSDLSLPPTGYAVVRKPYCTEPYAIPYLILRNVLWM